MSGLNLSAEYAEMKHLKGVGDSDRGNSFYNAGFAGNRSNGGNQTVSKPNKLDVTTKRSAQIMGQMSILLQKTNPSTEEVVGDGRAIDFAQWLARTFSLDEELVKQSLVEGITSAHHLALQYLTFHLDRENGKGHRRNLCLVCGVISGIGAVADYCRKVHIGYSRKSIDDYYRRDQRVGKAIRDIDAFVQFVKESGCYIPANADFMDNVEELGTLVTSDCESLVKRGGGKYYYKAGRKKGQVYHGPVFVQIPRQMDKEYLYSAMTWATERIILKFNCSFVEMVELWSIGTYVGSILRWFTVLDHLYKMEKLPNECLVWWFLRHCAETYQVGIKGGKCPRFQAPWNKPFFKRRVCAAVHGIWKVAKELQSTSGKPTKFQFNRLLFAFMAMPGVGEFAAHHGLHLMIRLRGFGLNLDGLMDNAILSPGTITFTKLRSRYGLKTDQQASQLLTGVTRSHPQLNERVAENLFCEFLKCVSGDAATGTPTFRLSQYDFIPVGMPLYIPGERKQGVFRVGGHHRWNGPVPLAHERPGALQFPNGRKSLDAWWKGERPPRRVGVRAEYILMGTEKSPPEIGQKEEGPWNINRALLPGVRPCDRWSDSVDNKRKAASSSTAPMSSKRTCRPFVDTECCEWSEETVFEKNTNSPAQSPCNRQGQLGRERPPHQPEPVSRQTTQAFPIVIDDDVAHRQKAASLAVLGYSQKVEKFLRRTKARVRASVERNRDASSITSSSRDAPTIVDSTGRPLQSTELPLETSALHGLVLSPEEKGRIRQLPHCIRQGDFKPLRSMVACYPEFQLPTRFKAILIATTILNGSAAYFVSSDASLPFVSWCKQHFSWKRFHTGVRPYGFQSFAVTNDTAGQEEALFASPATAREAFLVFGLLFGGGSPLLSRRLPNQWTLSTLGLHHEVYLGVARRRKEHRQQRQQGYYLVSHNHSIYMFTDEQCTAGSLLPHYVCSTLDPRKCVGRKVNVGGRPGTVVAYHGAGSLQGLSPHQDMWELVCPSKPKERLMLTSVE